MRRLLPVLTAMLLAAGCGVVTGDDTATGDAAPDDRLTSEVASDAGGQPGPGDAPGGSEGEPVGDGGRDVLVPTPSFTDDGVVASVVAGWEGACGIDEVASAAHQAVTGIPADDPDGGLNLREAPLDGEVIAVLPEGELVYVLDCVIHDDGGVWWLVDAGEPGAGYVNSAFLTDDLSGTDAERRGASAAEERVEWLLASLEVEDWDTAAEVIGNGGGSELAVDVGQSGVGSVDPASLAEWCATYVCDARWDIVDIRGTYGGGWEAPAVDVRFDYPGGPVVQTFELRLGPDDGSELDGLVGWQVEGIDGLPGGSVAAFRTDGPVDALAITPDLASADTDLIEAAEEVRAALLSEGGPRLPVDRMAAEGVVVSLDAFIEPTASDDVSLTVGDLDDRIDQVVLWGFADGTGYPVVDTVDGRLATYRRAPALLTPDEVGVDRRIGLGNTIDNLAEAFPAARVVEYHHAGRGDLADFTWTSVRLAFEPREAGWTLVALASDGWTI